MRRIALFLCLAGCVLDAPRNNNDIGAEYLGARYVSDPLGEGTGYDPDPLIRVDAFDCVTFVETALAGGDVGRLTKIRYRDAVVGFANRNHFMETDWMTNNADLVQNVSGKYAKTMTRNVVIDKAAWARRVHGMNMDAAPRAVGLEYVPYSELRPIRNNAPLIVLFIVGKSEKTDKIGTDIAVVHTGFLMPGGVTLRHASVGRGVVDDDWGRYVQMRRGMKNNIGVALVKIK